MVDMVVGYLLNKLYNKQQSGWEYNTRVSLEQTTEKVIILGDSRGLHNYIPNIISNKLGLSAYNAARDDQSIFYHYAVFTAIIKRYSPKIIILDVPFHLLDYDSRSYSQLKYLLPYYQNHNELRPIIEKISETEKIRLLSKVYPYNSLFFTLLKGQTKNAADTQNKGFAPLVGSKVTELKIKKLEKSANIDIDKKNYLQLLLQTCNKLCIKIYLCIAPYYYAANQNDVALQSIIQIANQYQVPIIDFSSNKTFLQQPSLFYNNENLNITGATLYTNLLMDTILSIKKR